MDGWRGALTVFAALTIAVPAAGQDECDPAHMASLLELEDVADVACLDRDGRRLVVAGPSLDAIHPTVVVASLEGERVLVRSERSLTAIHPEHPIPMVEAAGDLSVSISALPEGPLRVSLYFGDGADFRTVTEVAWIVRVGSDGRWTELGAILGIRAYNALDECLVTRGSQIAITRDAIRARYTYERRFEAQPDGPASAREVRARRAQCRRADRGPRPRIGRSPLRAHRLPALAGPPAERPFPASWSVDPSREWEGEELAALEVVASAWSARWMRSVSDYLAHFEEGARITSARGRVRPVAAEIRALRRGFSAPETGGDERIDAVGLRWATVEVDGDRTTVDAGVAIAAFSGEEGTFDDVRVELRRADGRWRIVRARHWPRYYAYYDDVRRY